MLGRSCWQVSVTQERKIGKWCLPLGKQGPTKTSMQRLLNMEMQAGKPSGSSCKASLRGSPVQGWPTSSVLPPVVGSGWESRKVILHLELRHLHSEEGPGRYRSPPSYGLTLESGLKIGKNLLHLPTADKQPINVGLNLPKNHMVCVG